MGSGRGAGGACLKSLGERVLWKQRDDDEVWETLAPRSLMQPHSLIKRQDPTKRGISGGLEKDSRCEERWEDFVNGLEM